FGIAEIPRRLVKQMNVVPHAHPPAGAVGAEGEIQIVQMKSVEVCFIERDRQRHLAPHREEYPIECLDMSNFAMRRAEDRDRKWSRAVSGRCRVDDLSEDEWRTGRHPAR